MEKGEEAKEKERENWEVKEDIPPWILKIPLAYKIK